MRILNKIAATTLDLAFILTPTLGFQVITQFFLAHFVVVAEVFLERYFSRRFIFVRTVEVAKESLP